MNRRVRLTAVMIACTVLCGCAATAGRSSALPLPHFFQVYAKI